MVKFNELAITNDGEFLVLDVSIANHTNYENVYIDSVVIDNQDTYSRFGPSAEPVFIKQFNVDKNSKVFRIRLNKDGLRDTPLQTTLFFVYVTVKGSTKEEPVKYVTNTYVVQPVADLQPVYNETMNIISGDDNHCQDDSKLVDLILKINSLDIALKTGNYPLAIKYWNKFFKNKRLKLITNKRQLND